MTAAWALLASLLWGTADFYGGTISRRLPVITVTFLSQVVGLAGAVGAAAVTGELVTPGRYLAWGLLAGLIGPVALMAFYRGLAIGTMGVVAPIASMGATLPVLVGLAGGERPSAAQLAGIVAALVGIVLASGPELRSGEAARGRSVGLALVAALGFGMVFVLIGLGSATSVAATLVAQRSVNVLLIGGVLLVARAARRPAGKPRPAASGATGAEARARLGDVPVLAGVGLADVAANGAYGLAAHGRNLAVAAVLASLYPVVTALLARQVHAERLRRVQVVGTAAAIGGAILIAGG